MINSTSFWESPISWITKLTKKKSKKQLNHLISPTPWKIWSTKKELSTKALNQSFTVHIYLKKQLLRSNIIFRTLYFLFITYIPEHFLIVPWLLAELLYLVIIRYKRDNKILFLIRKQHKNRISWPNISHNSIEYHATNINKCGKGTGKT